MPRLFLGITLPHMLRNQITTWQANLKKTQPNFAGCLFETEANLHLTIKFLGQTTNEQLSQLGNTLTKLLAQYPPFSLQTTELIFFPTKAKAHMIALAITPNEKLTILHQIIESACESHGFAKEARIFTPHITLVRLSHHLKKSFDNHGLTAMTPRTIQVERVTLFESTKDTNNQKQYLPLQYFVLGSPNISLKKPCNG